MGRIKTLAEADERLAVLDAERKEVKRVKRNIQNRAKAEERKKRNHALMVAGALVVKYAADGEWKALDYSRLEAYLRHWSSTMMKQCAAEHPLEDVAEADARVRAWEKAYRERGGKLGL